MQNNPLSTMAGNAVGRGNGDTAYSERIGDISTGAMGTHIGNRHGVQSNAVSDYNQVSMTDIQMNMNMIDATRGYGDPMGSSNDSLYATTSDSPGMFSMPSNDNSSLYNNDDALFRPGADNGSLYTPSAHMASPSQQTSPGLMSSPMASTMQVVSQGAPVFVPVSKINQNLNSDIAKKVMPMKEAISSTPVEVEKVKEDTLKLKEIGDKEKKVGVAKSSGAASLRPFENQKTFLDSKVIEKAEDSQKIQINHRLKDLSDEDFMKLVNKTMASVENEQDPRKKVINICKMNLLKSEIEKRFSEQKDAS